MQNHPNLDLLMRVAKELHSFVEQVVFVGGATTTLYLTKADHVKYARGTVDVDMILDVDRIAFYKVEETLRRFGFHHDQATTYRFIKGDLTVDVMPIEAGILGFTNRWYKEGFKNAETQTVEGMKVRILSFPYFLATKLEAFRGRGKNDYFGSKDFEDIVSVFAGRKGVLLDLMSMQGELKEFVRSEFEKHLANSEFRNALNGHVPQIEKQTMIANQIYSDLQEFVSSV